jgi:N-methylhydantoinase A
MASRPRGTRERRTIVIIGIDVGGTFTDLVARDPATGRLAIAKVPSTPADPSRGFLAALATRGPLPADTVVVHGTTVATNAILERKGARCGLITTRGFRDVLELRRRDRPHLYGLTGFFEPLIPREHRLEVDERIDERGSVVTPLDEAGVADAAAQLAADGVEVIVVSFLHAYANPAHEETAARIVQARHPALSVVVASAVLAEMREFERTSTAVVNGYIQPVMRRYLGRLDEEPGAAAPAAGAHRRSVLIVQSNGGLMSRAVAAERPVTTVLSGPAAGVMAGSALAREAGFANAITGDVGGTSFDVALVHGGQPRLADEMLVEFGVPIRVPHVDIVTIGAGGGSIAWLDRGGILHVGPRSAGAEPGPACYGQGGVEPTVTDAHLVLGHLSAERPLGSGGGPRLDPALARTAVARVAEPLGLTVEDAALAILSVANNNMAASIRSVSVERGYDPREFVFVAFGGAGPLHADALARAVEIPRALIPPAPGVTSALGCLFAPYQHDFVQTVSQPLAGIDWDAVDAHLARQTAEGLRLLAAEDVPRARATVQHALDMAYEGQIHTMRVPIARGRLDARAVAATFADVYARAYGYTLDDYPLVVLNVRTSVVGPPPGSPADGLAGAEPESRPARATVPPAPVGERSVYRAGAWAAWPLYAREALGPGTRLAGPLIVDQEDTTVLVEAESALVVDGVGNLILETTEAGRRAAAGQRSAVVAGEEYWQ